MRSSILESGGRYDVLVIGARAAGAGIALLLARQGLRVLVVDRGRYGTDTLSTHALMRAGVMQLLRMDVLPAIAAAGTPAITGASFVYGDDAVTVPIKPRDGVAALYAPRRTVLDRALVDRAAAGGATVMFDTAIVDVIRDRSERVTGAILRTSGGEARRVLADLVIGADGLHSTVAQLVRAPLVAAGRSSSAVVFGYWRGLSLREYRWYYGERVSAGVIPTNDGLTCVFAAVPTASFARWFQRGVPRGYHEVLEQAAPDMAPYLREDTRDGRLRGFAGTRGHLRQAAGPGWALIGDSTYFKDPLTAHGISDALIEAEYLSAAVLQNTDAALTAYSEHRNERVLPLFVVTDRIASFEWTLDEARALHKRLAGAMADEVLALRAFTRERMCV